MVELRGLDAREVRPQLNVVAPPWMVEREGFEPSKAKAARFTVWSRWPLGYLSTINWQNGAGDGTRTHDLRFTKPLLYQLSYSSIPSSRCDLDGS